MKEGSVRRRFRSPSFQDINEDGSLSDHEKTAFAWKAPAFRKIALNGTTIKAVILLFFFWNGLRFYRLLQSNLKGTGVRATLNATLLEHRNHCFDAGLRVYFAHDKPDAPKPMTSLELENQLPIMIPISNHTSGNLILQCTHQVDEQCRGIVKIFHSESIYYHVKRCLQILQNSKVTPQILYFDDETLTLVEEEVAMHSLWDNPIPQDFSMQMLNIRCILLKHGIVHRDISAPNFMVDQKTGRVYIIDFSDAFVWDDHWMERRNLVNVFNIWWKSHDEDHQRHRLVEDTKPRIKGANLWRRPKGQYINPDFTGQ